jgi:hypothetical protein
LIRYHFTMNRFIVVIFAKIFASLRFSAYATERFRNYPDSSLALKAYLGIVASKIRTYFNDNFFANSTRSSSHFVLTNFSTHRCIMSFAKSQTSSNPSANTAMPDRCMSLCVRFVVYKFKVFQSIVRSVSVYMMNQLRFAEFTIKEIAHNHSVLHNISPAITLNMSRSMEEHIAMVNNHAPG